MYKRQPASAAFAWLVSEEAAANLALVGTLLGDADAPYVPRATITQTKHRVKTPIVEYEIYPACVARKVPRSEWVKDKCKQALDKGWNRLRDMPWPNGKGKGTWNESKVVEASEVRKRANKPGAKPVHFSRICEDERTGRPAG